MEIFNCTSLFKFNDRFKTDLDCLQYLYDLKWKKGFTCVKCGNTTSWENTAENGKVCKNCRRHHSTTSNTIFHGLRFPILKAFNIAFEVSSSTKSLSALQIARRFDVNRKTAWLFARKIREAMKSSKTLPMKNNIGENEYSESKVYVDDFQVGGYEPGEVGKSSTSKKRNICIAVETTIKGKIKRVYGVKIKDFSSEELGRIFDDHIKEGTHVITDGWSGYKPLSDQYNIDQRPREMKTPSNPVNRMVQLFKSSRRGVFHKSTARHIQSYLNEFCFKINRSQWKEGLFHACIKNMVEHQPFTKNMASF